MIIYEYYSEVHRKIVTLFPGNSMTAVALTIWLKLYHYPTLPPETKESPSNWDFITVRYNWTLVYHNNWKTMVLYTLCICGLVIPIKKVQFDVLFFLRRQCGVVVRPSASWSFGQWIEFQSVCELHYSFNTLLCHPCRFKS